MQQIGIFTVQQRGKSTYRSNRMEDFPCSRQCCRHSWARYDQFGILLFSFSAQQHIDTISHSLYFILSCYEYSMNLYSLDGEVVPHTYWQTVSLSFDSSTRDFLLASSSLFSLCLHISVIISIMKITMSHEIWNRRDAFHMHSWWRRFIVFFKLPSNGCELSIRFNNCNHSFTSIHFNENNMFFVFESHCRVKDSRFKYIVDLFLNWNKHLISNWAVVIASFDDFTASWVGRHVLYKTINILPLFSTLTIITWRHSTTRHLCWTQ